MNSGLIDCLEQEELRELENLPKLMLPSCFFSSGSANRVICFIWIYFMGEFRAVLEPVGSDDSAVD